MRTDNFFFRTVMILGIMHLCIVEGSAQLRSLPSGGNKKAMVAEQIGITRVEINYHRPGVKGREGKIYGTSIVHKGFMDKTPEYGTSKSAPWRAGANENTTIEFDTEVKVEGKTLPAGKYGFFVAYGPEESIVIFSKDNASWGNYFYDEKNDALRAAVKNVKLEKSVEWLKYEFINQTDNSVTIALQWENVMIPFKVEVDYVKTQINSFRNELKGDKGFGVDGWVQASSFCLQHDTNLEEGLQWAGTAVTFKKDFNTLSNLALFHEKLGHQAKSDSLMKEALPMGSMQELHQYGRRLVGMKKNVQALDVFKFNAKKHPKDFTTMVGLARGYSANGDFKNALVQAKTALPLAPNEPNKKAVTDMITKLENQKDIN